MVDAPDLDSGTLLKSMRVQISPSVHWGIAKR